jgi:pimeloyl-ACP methyl ester carboxylesterase
MTAANVADQVLRLGDGRALGFKVYGDPAGAPLLFLHGTPGSRLKFAIGHEAGNELGLAIVAPDRWGYGLSDPPKVPALEAFAADMAALMDHLGHAQFAVGGISGGGPYAAAVAAGLASRVTALALVSPMGPIDDPECRRSLVCFHRFAFTVLPRSPRAIAAVFALFRVSLARSSRLAAELATLRAGARDKALLRRPDVARWLLGSFREGLRSGVAEPVCDMQLFSRSWGVDLGAIRAPARAWIGAADTAVPISAARLLARSIPGCALKELPAEGHFWVAANYRAVLDWIAVTIGAGRQVDRSLQGATDNSGHASRRHLSDDLRATDVRPARYARKVRARP